MFLDHIFQRHSFCNRVYITKIIGFQMIEMIEWTKCKGTTFCISLVFLEKDIIVYATVYRFATSHSLFKLRVIIIRLCSVTFYFLFETIVRWQKAQL